MSEQKTVGGHFQIISELSSGGFGQTFLAEDLRLPNKPKCVAKQLKPQSNDPKIIELAGRLFEQEVVALYQLGKHPQIPTLITHFEENSEFYFVQEHIEGNTFERELQLGKVYNQSKVIEIVSQLLDVLSFVHKQNVIHRDIKPANLINRISDGKIVLIDFGAVKQVTNQTAIYPNQTPQNTIAIGSDGFMPPEQLAGQPRFSSDVYAVGMFAVQLLTQTHPTQLRQNQRTGEWIWQDKTNVNPRFAEVVSQMIRYDFRQRFANAIEANYALNCLNLNGTNRLPELWKEKSYIPQNFQNRPTQATHFRPKSANENFHNQPQNFQNNNFSQQPQQFQQPQNYQGYNQPINTPPRPIKEYAVQNPSRESLLEQNRTNKNIFEPSSPISLPTQPVGQAGQQSLQDSENVTLNSSESSIWDYPQTKGFLFAAGVVVALAIICSQFAPNSMMSRAFSDSPASVPVTENVTTESSYKSLALQKEAKAVTSEDWRRVAQEWQAAVDYYTLQEMTATSETEKSDAKKDQTYCLERKLDALRKSDTIRKQTSFK
jgi:serine/threonine protein kinase